MTSLGQEIRPYFTNLSDEWILIVEKPAAARQSLVDYPKPPWQYRAGGKDGCCFG